MAKNNGVSLAVIRRMPRYYRYLGELLDRGIDRVSSKNLADMLNLTASQIRQDFNCFGGFGQQGYGYNVAALRGEIKNILALNHQFDTILVGAGNLGRAFSNHIDFSANGFNLVAVFDRDPALAGHSIGGVTIRPSSDLVDFCNRHHPTLAMICVPESAAQAVVTNLIDCGVRSFWNFSHYDIEANHENVVVENVHLGDSLMTLCYRIADNKKD